MKLVNRDVFAHSHELAEAFQRAQFFPHVEIKNFFEPDVCRQLIAEFPPYRPENAVNEMGEVGLKASRRDVANLGTAYAQLDAYVQTPEFLELMSSITGIPDLLYDPDYFGGGTHENLHGTELDIHVDFNYHPQTRWHRRLNLIVFLNDTWEASWGGCFQVFRDPWDPDSEDLETFPPFFNNAVIFETNEVSWHGFTKIDLPADQRQRSRKSLALYFYTKERPDDQTASPHATVYVPRPLPPELVPGYTLKADDLQRLKVLLQKRDQQIRFLYDREKELTQVIDGGIHMSSHEKLPRFVAGHTLSQEDADTLAGLFHLRDQQLGFFREREKELAGMMEGLMQRLREAEGRVEALSGVQVIGGPVIQTSPIDGIWDDQWVGGSLDVGFRALEPLTGLGIEMWSPAEFPEGRRLRVQVADQVHEQELTTGKLSLELPIAIEPSETEYRLRIDVTPTYCYQQAGTGQDQRELGFSLQFLTFQTAS